MTRDVDQAHHPTPFLANGHTSLAVSHYAHQRLRILALKKLESELLAIGLVYLYPPLPPESKSTAEFPFLSSFRGNREWLPGAPCNTLKERYWKAT
ncbi:hypothetical protein A7C99_1259 [Trichophyton rubrum]|uniref:Uncharacterized protein n=1 Tax=Trichophyton rubrum TaxID=5551 RepID=A0A178F619_TRIRU|nr:hypothetical protein HL42_4279 [Trichophyton rubrum]OAL67395.1 hypothetical protein A7C99_1259 [Trichophyton rubrum]